MMEKIYQRSSGAVIIRHNAAEKAQIRDRKLLKKLSVSLENLSSALGVSVDELATLSAEDIKQKLKR